MGRQLNSGDLFPEFKIQTVDGKPLNIPKDLKGEYSVILFYRGGW